MFPEQDGPTASLSDDFIKALRLLHSSEPSSAEALRCLLDASIAERYGNGKTIGAWLRRKKKLDELFGEAESEGNSSDGEGSKGKRRQVEGSFTDSRGNDVGGKDEVPRISIPDEEQNDGALCKVCNVSEFGLLILIQCRECGELYHPLCHQPPVVEARVHDPNFLWRCSECEQKLLVNSTRDALLKDSVWVRGDVIKKYSRKSVKQKLTSKFSKR